ncbi:flippase [bacterium]|nr:flippase [bacterium]MCI0603858.1 flippase [bacterium]
MTSLKRLASNYSLLVAGEALSKFFSFVAFMYLARILGPKAYGYMEFTLAVMVFFTLFVDMGSGPWGARRIPQNPENIPETITSVLLVRSLLALVGFVLLYLFSRGIAEELPRKLLLIYGITLFAIPGFLQWVFQGLQNMRWVAWATVVRQFFFSFLIFAIIRQPKDLLAIGWIECISVAAVVLFIILTVRRVMGGFQFRWNSETFKQGFLQSAPIGFSELSWAFIWYSSTVILGLIVGGRSLGWFAAAHRPIMAMHTFVFLYFYNLLPSLAQATQESTDVLRKLLNRSLALSCWTSLCAGTMATIFAEFILTFIFGTQYQKAVTTFQILIWVLVAMMITGHYSYTLVGWNLQKFHMISFLAALAASLLLSPPLILRYQIIGAALAILGALLVKGILAWYFVRRYVTVVPLIKHLIKPLAPTILSLLIYWNFPGVHPLILAISVPALFAACLVFLQPDLFTRLRLAWQD